MENNPPSADEVPLHHAQGNPNGARILIVDDDGEVAQALAEMAAQLGHAPTVCNRADEVLRYLDFHKVDLMLIDYRMPEMTGLDVVLLLRQENRNIPVVMMTGYAQTKSRVSAGQLDEFIILKKPITTSQLAKAIEESLKAIKL